MCTMHNHTESCCDSLFQVATFFAQQQENRKRTIFKLENRSKEESRLNLTTDHKSNASIVLYVEHAKHVVRILAAVCATNNS